MTGVGKKLAIPFMLCLFFLLFARTFAFDDTVRQYIEENGRYSGGLITGLDKDVTQYISYANNGGEMVTMDIEGHSVTFYVLAEDQTKMAEAIAKHQAAVQASQGVENKVNDTVGNIGITADTQTASEMLSGFVPMISTFVGILCVLISLGMTFITAIDVIYIEFPMFQRKCEEQKMSGHGIMSKKSSSGENEIRFVTQEAQYAVQEANVENGKNPLFVYIKKRLVSFIVLAILLTIFFTGNISLITNLAVDVVQGIMNVLAG